jgi:hypothetical protein
MLHAMLQQMSKLAIVQSTQSRQSMPRNVRKSAKGAGSIGEHRTNDYSESKKKLHCEKICPGPRQVLFSYAMSSSIAHRRGFL